MVASTELNELERLLIVILRRDGELDPSPYAELKGMIRVSSQVIDPKSGAIRLTEVHEWRPALSLVTNVHLSMSPARHGVLIVKTDRGVNVRLRPYELSLLMTAIQPPERRPSAEDRFAELLSSAKALAEY